MSIMYPCIYVCVVYELWNIVVWSIWMYCVVYMYVQYTYSKHQLTSSQGPDLAQIIMATITSFDIKGKTFDIGGPVVYEHGTIANVIADMLELNVRYAELPQEVGRCVLLCDVMLV